MQLTRIWCLNAGKEIGQRKGLFAVQPLEVALLLVGVAEIQVEGPEAQQLPEVPGHVDVVE